MNILAFDLAVLLITMLLVPPVLTARSFAKHGDRLALRRLKFILPFQLFAALLLVLGICAMKIPDPTEILIPGAIAFGAVGALLSLMLHAIDRQ